jgi:hypothetical protein
MILRYCRGVTPPLPYFSRSNLGKRCDKGKRKGKVRKRREEGKWKVKVENSDKKGKG